MAAKAAGYRSLTAQAVQASTAPAAAAAQMMAVGDLRVDPDINGRESLRDDVIEDYRDHMLAAGGWGPFPPAEACYDGAIYWLWAGFHRRAAFLQAAGAAGWDLAIPVNVRPGSRRDAILLASPDNSDHGLRRSVGDKRKVVDRLLSDPEWSAWSDAAIARACKVSAPFVGERRRIMAQTAAVAGGLQGAQPAERRYIDKHGAERVMDTSGIAASNQARAAGSSVVGSSAASSRNVGAALGKCAVCGRPLSDPVHAAQGCGPVCSAKRAAGSAAAAASEDLTVNVAGVPSNNYVPAVASGGLLGGVGPVRARLLALLDDLAEYVGITGDTAGAEVLRRGALAALDRLAALGEG